MFHLRQFNISDRRCSVVAGKIFVGVVLVLGSVGACLATDATKLHPNQQQHLRAIKAKLVTRLNSKTNPGDRDTWYVLIFRDGAQAETSTQSATMLGRSTFGWSSGKSTQQKIASDFKVVRGRSAAAMAVLEYLYSPHNAVNQLQAPSSPLREGWMKRQATSIGVGREWRFFCCETASEAYEVLEQLKQKR